MAALVEGPAIQPPDKPRAHISCPNCPTQNPPLKIRRRPFSNAGRLFGVSTLGGPHWCAQLAHSAPQRRSVTRGAGHALNGLPHCLELRERLKSENWPRLPSFLACFCREFDRMRPLGVLLGVVIGVGALSGTIWLGPYSPPA